jgi:hypothetical protein
VNTILRGGLLVTTFFVTGRGLAEPPVAPARTDALGRTGDASVSLGVVRELGDVHSVLGGFVRVEVPFDRLAAPRRPLVASADDARFVPDDGRSAPEDDTLRDDARLADADEPEAAAAPALEPALLGVLARETLAAAQNAHGVRAFDRDLDSASSRARTSAMLPEVRLRAARTRDAALHLTPTVDDPYHSTLADGDGTLIEAQATFRLNRLIFADEEVLLERLRIERERLNERLEIRVLAKIAAWHRALSREWGNPDPELRGRAALARVNAEIELDVLTDGWFGARVRRLGLEAPPVERRAPAPKNPASPQPAPKSSRPAEDASSVAHLDGCAGSATSRAPCLPRLVTDSRTFSGASMR